MKSANKCLKYAVLLSVSVAFAEYSVLAEYTAETTFGRTLVAIHDINCFYNCAIMAHARNGLTLILRPVINPLSV
jgi:hypothetical protein